VLLSASLSQKTVEFGFLDQNSGLSPED